MAAEGWQASALRLRNEEWHRASFHHPFEMALPVVLTQVQNYEERTKLLTTRQHLSPGPLEAQDSNSSTSHFSLFVQAEGEGIWSAALSTLDSIILTSSMKD